MTAELEAVHIDHWEYDLRDGRKAGEEINSLVSAEGGIGRVFWYEFWMVDFVVFHYCALKGYTNLIRLFLAREDCEINLLDNMGRTSLHWAAAHGQEAVVQMLLGCDKAVAFNLADGAGKTPLHHAAYAGHVGVVNLLLDCENILVDSTDVTGITPLYWASTAEIATILLDHGADPSIITTQQYQTPLAYACAFNPVDKVRVLLEHGASPIVGELLNACFGDDKEAKVALIQQYIGEGITE